MLSKDAVDEKSIFADLHFAEIDGRSVAGRVLYMERNGHQMAGIATRAGGRVWVYLGGVDACGGASIQSRVWSTSAWNAGLLKG